MIRRHPMETSAFRSEAKSTGGITDFVVGIDTGGTYTDSVLLDYKTRTIITFGKTLTTREDLTIGIIKSLKKLRIKDPAKIKLVGISSTLATNSIAEGKAKQTGLLLIGYDRDLVSSYGLQKKFPTKNINYFRGGHTSQGEEKEPLDLKGIKAWVIKHQSDLEALAISSYFSPLNPSHEEQAFEAIRKICSLPVVLGHQLSTKLDSIKRATTACLNASLVAIMQEFIEAVRESLKDQGIHAPLMIVKGDGSLMPYTEAVHKPVETIISGPAASAIGGRFLSGCGNALVIDVGGTTTDMALINNFEITISEEGARVGEIETAVKAARIRTIGLGCDSRISFGPGSQVQVGPERVVPLSRLASRFPRVKKEILNLKKKRILDWRPTDTEYWFLYKEIDPEKLSSEDLRHNELLQLLNKGPLSLTELLKKADVYHPVQLNADHLIHRGYIEHSTLTPTDLLHVNGQMNKWDTKVALQAVECACEIYEKNRRTFVEETLDLMAASMVEEAVIFLARQIKEDLLPKQLEGSWGKWLFEEALTGKNPFLSVTIASRFQIIGIGAPAEIFIKRVSDTLKAPFVLPDHAPVANAAGAVAGSIMVEKEAIIYLQETEDARTYVVQIEGEATRFMEMEDARTYAEKIVLKLARDGAIAFGAVDPQVVIEDITEGALRRILARAVGNPKLSEQGGSLFV